MRVSLGCNFKNAALPVPEISHSPSQIEGAVKRIACRMPAINRARLRRLKRFCFRFLNHHFKDDQFTAEENFEFEDFITKTPYTQTRKEELTKINKNIFNIDGKGFNVHGFTKDENYPEYKHFRGIMSRSDDYKTRVGPFFRKFDKILFNKKFFIKKIPVTQRAQWLSEKFRFAREIYCTDFTSFEATFGPLLMKIEMSIYSWFLKNNPNHDKIMNLLRSGIGGINKIKYSQFLFTIFCRRMSGEMNTSGGNGLMNLMMTYFILEERGNPLDLSTAFEGDDGCIEINSIYTQPTPTDYSDLGANIKIDKPDSPSEASFCGLIYDVQALDNVTDPVDCLMSFGWTTQQYAGACNKKLLALLRSKSLSMLYEYPACPILKELALYGLRMTQQIDDTYLEQTIKKEHTSIYYKEQWVQALEYYKHGKMINKPINLNTRYLVQKRYNIPISLQYKIEKYLNNLNILTEIDIPELYPLIHKDCFHYYTHYAVHTHDPQKFTYINYPKRKYKIYYYDMSNDPNPLNRQRIKIVFL
jgi:hypothetical protein